MDGLVSLLKLAVIFIGLFAVSDQAHRSDGFQRTLGHIKPRSSGEVQANAAQALVARLLGKEKSKLFLLIVDSEHGPVGKDTFTVIKNSLGHIEINGTSGVAAVWGFHYYLKNYCNCHISWEGNQLQLPNTLPDVRVQITSNDRFRYYQNVCTLGYSSVWWQWDQWERHIDWMALNGINLALAFNGQEAIWERVYSQFNLTQDEIDEHFGGPAFLPWTRMGNIRGFGGPLSAEWHARSIHLQHRILQRMRELGIIPVLPAFSGHVPRAFSRLFPSANMTKIHSWNNFEDKYCCPYFLDPKEALFQSVGEAFLKAYIAEFGTDHIYNCDPFNENEPDNSELSYLRNVGQSIFSAMNSVDSKAIWLMQGWLFFHDIIFWTKARVEAFLTSVPIGRMVVLDLQSEQFPQYTRLKSYYGQPFIWCMLHNFGGTLGMFGAAPIINQRAFEGRNMANSTMVGTGLTPEGIYQNYVIYDLMNEMAYRREPVNLDVWFANYASRRYGAWNEYASVAWKNLGRTIYNYTGTEKIRGHYVITKRPSLKIIPWTWYSYETFFSTWSVFLKARYGRGNNTLYRHDVVDLTRQALQLKADGIYMSLVDAAIKRNLVEFQSSVAKLMELFDDLEKILASGKDFLLGKWLEEAKNAASNENDRRLFEYNAKNQISLWGPRGEIRDYANKQWSGVVADYFKPRWAVFSRAAEDFILKRAPLNFTKINEMIFEQVEKPFTFNRRSYPTEPQGDCIDIAVQLLSKWNSKYEA